MTRGAESKGKGGYAGRRQEDDQNIVAHSITTRAGNASRNAGSNGNIVSHTLNAKGGGGWIDAESETFVVSHTLKGGGFDASEDGTGRGMPLVPHVVGTLNANGRAAGSTTQQDAHSGMLVPMAFAENSRAELRLEGGDGQTVASLKTGGGKPGQSYPAICYDASDAHFASAPVAFRTTGNDGVYETGGVAPCLNTGSDPNHTLMLGGGDVDAHAMAVRRLTPRECERLQGFPDDYTAIDVRGKRAKDGPRYKALGNSWAVPKMRWVGERISIIDARCDSRAGSWPRRAEQERAT